MKTFILLFLVVMFLPVAAFTQTEVETWYWDSTATVPWVYQGTGNVQSLARCWALYPELGYCNKDWNIPVLIHASIAQWLDWSMSGTRWDWRVRKPGRYGADCITATIKSNQNVLIDYEDFNDLHADSVGAGNPDIPIWYHVSALGAALPLVGSSDWTRAIDLNKPAEWDTLYDSMALHAGLQFKLWNMIEVIPCNSACEYTDHATISLKLLCQKPWIDRTTGYFNAVQDFTNNPHP